MSGGSHDEWTAEEWRDHIDQTEDRRCGTCRHMRRHKSGQRQECTWSAYLPFWTTSLAGNRRVELQSGRECVVWESIEPTREERTDAMLRALEERRRTGE